MTIIRQLNDNHKRAFLWRALMLKILGDIKSPFFLFGAGKHSESLLDLQSAHKLFAPTGIIDDAPSSSYLRSVPCILPSEVSKQKISPIIILLSSDQKKIRDAMRKSILSNKDLSQSIIIDPYEGLPDGPYKKDYS